LEIVRKFLEKIYKYLEKLWEILAFKYKIKQILVINTKKKLYGTDGISKRFNQDFRRITQFQIQTQANIQIEKPKKI
jgi:hypothetical protein